MYPAAIFADPEPHLITTILGSCVAVCLYDPVHHIGGMNHFMLPLWNGNGLASPRYGNIAIERLIEKFAHIGGDLHVVQAKLFGGANIIESKIRKFHIGEHNINIALELLAQKRIAVVAKSIGGREGRKILFNTFTGEVLMKRISNYKDRIE